MHFPKEGMSFADEDRLFAWLEEHRDPELWHQLALYMDHDSGLASKYLLWIVSQPDCDASTALAAFVIGLGHEYLYADEAPSDPYWQLAKAIGERANANFYRRTEIANPEPFLDANLEAVRTALRTGYERRAAQGGPLPLAPPESLFDRDFPADRFLCRYLIDQDAIVRIDALDDRVQQLLGTHHV